MGEGVRKSRLTLKSRWHTKLRMPSRITWATNVSQVLDSLKEFNSDSLRGANQKLAWDLIRRTQYWVHDVPSQTFGPSKFVGFESMTYDTYQQARDGKSTGDRFDGFHTRVAIEKALDAEFSPNKRLHRLLVQWAEALVGPLVFDKVAEEKWQFVSIRAEQDGNEDLSKSWSDWSPLDDTKIEDVPAKPGAYEFRAVDEKNRTRTIRRCFGEDRNGVLGIGESNNLRTRLAALLRCMQDPEQAGHMAGWRYAYLKMEQIYPLGRIQFRFRTTCDKDAAYELEGTLLHEYVARHFEMPPLNYKFNWSVWDKANAQ